MSTVNYNAQFGTEDHDVAFDFDNQDGCTVILCQDPVFDVPDVETEPSVTMEIDLDLEDLENLLESVTFMVELEKRRLKDMPKDENVDCCGDCCGGCDAEDEE